MYSMATSKNATSMNKLFFGKKPSFLNFMKEFGRIGHVTKREKIVGKLEDRAVKYVFVGYGANHSEDMYMMYNPATKRIILSRDVKLAEFKKTDPKDNMYTFVKYNSTDTVPGIDELVVELKENDKKDKNEVVEIADGKNNGAGNLDKVSKNVQNDPNRENQLTRLEREMRKIDTSYNPTVPVQEEKNEPIRDGNAVVIVNANVVPVEIPKEEMADFCAEIHNTAVNSDVGDPKLFEQALGTKDPFKCPNYCIGVSELFLAGISVNGL